MNDQASEARWTRLIALLRPVHARALATARRLCRSPADGDDLYQDTVLRAFTKLHTLRDESRFGAWFHATLLSRHRSRARQRFWGRVLALEDLPPGMDPAGEDGRGWTAEIVQADRAARALGSLAAVQREAVVLFEIDGYSIEEIAEMQRASVTAVKSRLARGREKLRRFYERQGWAPTGDKRSPGRARRGAPPGRGGSGFMSERSENEDVQALGAVTARDLPEVDRVVALARLRGERKPAAWREWLMSSTYVVKRRPWVASAFAVVLIALILLVVPISYERTTGHQVTLTLAKSDLTPATTIRITHEFRRVLAVEQMTVRAGESGPVLSATVPARSGASAPVLAQALAQALQARGIPARVSVEPVRERVSGTVLAYARDRIITINADGKSAAELENEIRQRFAEAGVPDVHVSVADEPGGRRKLTVEVQRKQLGGAPSGGEPEAEVPGLVITRNGSPAGTQGFDVRVMRKRGPAGESLRVQVTDGEKTAAAEVQNPEALGDAAVAAEIESQLARAGIEARVSVSGGKIQIEKK